MKTNLGLVLCMVTLMLFSCRKDSIEKTEYIEVIIEDDNTSGLIENPEIIVQGNVLMVKQEDEVVLEMKFNKDIVEAGGVKPIFVKIGNVGCDNADPDHPCGDEISMFIDTYTKVEEQFFARLKGKLWVENELKEVEVVLSGELDEDFQKICGQLWYDANKNDIFDTHENGINGVKVTIETDEGVYQTDVTGIKFSSVIDGYFELMASTKKLNTITVDLPPLGLKFVEKNVGGNPDKDSDFDQNGQVVGLKVNKGEKIKLDAGVKQK